MADESEFALVFELTQPLSIDELKNAPVGTIIKPHGDSERNWYVVALKAATSHWTVTGHGEVVDSFGLRKFARRWEKVTALVD